MGTMLTVNEVAERLNVTRNTVVNWIASGVLPAHKIVGVVRVDSDALADLLRRTSTTTSTAPAVEG